MRGEFARSSTSHNGALSEPPPRRTSHRSRAETRSTWPPGSGRTRRDHDPGTARKPSPWASSHRPSRLERTRQSSRPGIAEVVSRASSRSGAFGRSIEQGEKSLQNRNGWRRAAGNMKVDRDDLRDPSDHCVTAGETSAIPCAISQGNDPFRVGGRMIGSFQGIAHVFGHGPGDHSTSAWRGEATNRIPKRSTS